MDAKKMLAIATLVVLASACTAMRDSSRYWSDTMAQDGAAQLHAGGRSASSPNGPKLP
jgi:hypothetical protein